MDLPSHKALGIPPEVGFVFMGMNCKRDKQIMYVTSCLFLAPNAKSMGPLYQE